MRRVMGWVMLVGALAHCGGGSDASNNNDGQGAQPAPSPTNGGGGPACKPQGATDDPDDNGVDANCDGADGVVGKDVYASANAGNDTNAGTPHEPLRSLSAAIALATTRGGRVLLASGSYDVDAIKTPGTWHVFGGYDGTFYGAPRRAETTLKASPGGLLVDQASDALLAHLTVKSAAPAPDSADASTYAIRSRAKLLTLDDVVVAPSDARDGASGKAGVGGEDGIGGIASSVPAKPTCKGIAQPDFSWGAYPGSVNAEGGSMGVVSTKERAAVGDVGAAATDGADAPGAPKLVGDELVVDVGQPGASNGRPGYGGAGGGGGGAPGAYWAGGPGGSGGCPGAGGEGGHSGGASVGILVLAGSVHVTRSEIGTGLGGAGGDGGAGGLGGKGGSGGAPTPLAPNPNTYAPTCDPATDHMNVGCAAYGGAGGAGGAGGHGGGGAGGWAIGLAIAPGAQGDADAATVFKLGRPGDGGTGAGGGRAPDGKGVPSLALH